MKRITALMIVLSLFAIGKKGNANNNFNNRDTIPSVESLRAAKDSLLFTTVEKDATYPGGCQAWLDFLSSHVNADVPLLCGAKPGSYTVAIQFIVEPDGKVTHVKGLTHFGFGMEREVVRVIRKSKQWEPAMQNGRYVRAYRKQPMTFNIAEAPKTKIKFSDLFSRDKK
ncbi:energy transducer TonB [Niabella soli]|nr:energy transducer TonB [Niabella soli]